MNSTQNYFKRIFYNSKLNREKFIINKKKMNEKKSIQIRKFCTYQQKEPENDPKFDWNLIAICSIAAYTAKKMNENKKR